MGLRVHNPGLATTVQDEGRHGYREWGVPSAGSFDRASAALANALLGNPSDCAVLEMALLGGTYEAEIPLGLALAGAPLEAAVLTADGVRRPLAIPRSFPLSPGDRLILGGATTGARCYLAAWGGWRTPIILGSRSREERLQPGALLPAVPSSTRVMHPSEIRWETPTATPFRVIDGPDTGPDFAADFWDTRTFQVGRESDRMGIRLEGSPLPDVRQPVRLSAPVALGAIQVAGGQAIILGVACGTMGGYPHVAHVISADLDRLGQLLPGALLQLRRVPLAEARALDAQERSARARRLLRIRAIAADGAGALSED